MPARNDLNDRIAIAKGWRWKKLLATVRGYEALGTHWRNPKGRPALRPDFTGTLEGVAGMLWELGNWEWLPTTKERAWYLPRRDEITENWICMPHQRDRPMFISGLDRPGDCVGDAYLSMKEAADANAK